MPSATTAAAGESAALDVLAQLMGSGSNSYTLSGSGNESYAARFTWFVFRYAEITNWPGELTADQLRAFGAEIPKALDHLWPARLTAVVRRGAGTIAARVPDLAWLRRLLETTGPLVSTSVNRSGDPPISSIDEVAKELAEGIDAALLAESVERAQDALEDERKVKQQLTGAATSIENARKILEDMTDRVRDRLADIDRQLAGAADDAAE